VEFSKVEVVKTNRNTHFIEWDIAVTADPPESVDDYNFKILWSKDIASGYIYITNEINEDIVIDGAVGPLVYEHPIKQYDFNQDHYYKVQAINKFDDQVTVYSGIVYIGMYKNGVHEVMRHAENVMYNRFHGEPCFVIKRKSFGARCPTCWSNERQQRIRTHCDTCKGTGFVSGYYQPIDVQISFDSDPKKVDLQTEWENVYDTKRARMSNYPLVRPKDLVVNKDDYKRYVIVHVETTKLPRLSESEFVLSKQNYIISQILTLEELNPDDNEYFLDVENIPPIPQEDDGQSGSTTPWFNDHKPVTTSFPLSVNNNQHVSLLYNADDFGVDNNGRLYLKNSGGGGGVIKEFISGEVIPAAHIVMCLDENLRVVPCNYKDKQMATRVVGLSMAAAAIFQTVLVQVSSYITDELWDWDVGKYIFFDEYGVLTQAVPTSGFLYYVAKPINKTTIEMLSAPPVLRA